MKGCRNHCYTGIEEGKDTIYLVLYYLSKGFEPCLKLTVCWTFDFNSSFTLSLIDGAKREVLDYSFH